MSYTIAIAGKGGSGKTTVSALIIRHLLNKKKDPILAVDADPNFNLDIALGLDIPKTIAQVREEVKSGGDSNLPRPEQLKCGIEDCLVESTGLDLIVMGRPEGAGCYCAVNNILRDTMSSFNKKYRYLVIDNEAGMEHLSRRTADNIDRLYLVARPTKVGVRSAINALDTVSKIDTKIRKIYLILNGVSGQIDESIKKMIKESGLEVAGEIPFNEEIQKRSESGQSLKDLDNNSAIQTAIDQIMEKTIWTI